MFRVMKTLTTLLATSALAYSGWVHAQTIPHLDLEMSGAEYAPYLEQSFGVDSVRRAGELDPILQFGQKNLQWLIRINAHRGQLPALSFSRAETQQGIPPEAPRIYNASIVQQKYAELVAQLPQPMKAVLVDGQPLTDALPVDEAVYLDFGLKVDRVYQLAARWLTMEPYLMQLSMRKKQDLRGYYFLSKTENLQAKLQGFAALAEGEKTEFKNWLTGLCFNSDARSNCDRLLATAIQNRAVWGFYQRYVAAGLRLWNSYFTMPEGRSDVTWNSREPNLMTVPFAQPPTPVLQDFLRVNIEDEWKFGNWRLALNFIPTSNPNTTHLEFEAGATPHVNGIAGNIITMDANAPLSEYDVQWTIRHEYGHVLGFPDCYIEFYDSESRTIINYQLDISNLMCSRRGHLKETHFNELRRLYYRP